MSKYHELYRNQYHYSSAKNWLNDPNGLLFDDVTKTYHLFYQYNPDGNLWGNMSWGHATSSDLFHWKEKNVAIPELMKQGSVDFFYTNSTGEQAGQTIHYIGDPTTNWGKGGNNLKKSIFSGSAVIDKENISGLGENAILLFFTADFQVSTRTLDTSQDLLGDWIGYQEVQEQHLAYSTDGGQSFLHYSIDGNRDQPKPIIPVTQMPAGNTKDFRDPKVVFDAKHNKWIMVLVAGQEVQIFVSDNLLKWTYSSSIKREHDIGVGVWECPDLIPMTLADRSELKWVLMLSVQTGAPASGSGMQYMIGTLDAAGIWYPDSNNTLQNPHWLDHGEDFYAGVTFFNAPGNRHIMIAWMSNWAYFAEQKTTPWYGHMTLPRELILVSDSTAQDGFTLRQQSVNELVSISNIPIIPEVNNGFLLDNNISLVTNFKGKQYQVEANFCWETENCPNYVGIHVRSTKDSSRKIYIGYDVLNNLAYVNRLSTGESNIGPPDRDRMNVYVPAPDNRVHLMVQVDESAIEVFINQGEQTISQVFYFRPEIIGLGVDTSFLGFYAENGRATVNNAVIIPFNNIWS